MGENQNISSQEQKWLSDLQVSSVHETPDAQTDEQDDGGSDATKQGQAVCAVPEVALTVKVTNMRPRLRLSQPISMNCIVALETK